MGFNNANVSYEVDEMEQYISILYDISNTHYVIAFIKQQHYIPACGDGEWISMLDWFTFTVIFISKKDETTIVNSKNKKRIKIYFFIDCGETLEIIGIMLTFLFS